MCRFGCECLEQIPALLSGGRDQRSDNGEVRGALLGAEATGDFCRNFIIRPSRTARLLVNGTLGSVRKRSTSALRVLSRSSRLWPTRRGGGPRGRAFVKAGCAV